MVSLSCPTPIPVDLALAGALERAAASIARLDQASALHPLLPALLYRARLEAVRQQAAVDGLAIDPWHLAAMIEGLRPRMDRALRIIDRGGIFDAARHALTLHGWLTAPDVGQEREIQGAQAALGAADAGPAPLLAAAAATHAWLDRGCSRPPIRVALIRTWTRRGLIRAPFPLTGISALRPDAPWQPTAWAGAFLSALADEADAERQRLTDMERAWFAARGAVATRRRNSRAPAAVDILAAAPLISATSLAQGLGMAVKNAIALLDRFCVEGIAVEVTHRSKRRLFGLTGIAPLRDGVAAPRRPEPGRGRGRPRPRDTEPQAPPPPDRPLTPLERRAFDYGEIERWMTHADQAIRNTRRTLLALAQAGKA